MLLPSQPSKTPDPLEALASLESKLRTADSLDAILWHVTGDTIRPLGLEDCVIYITSLDQPSLIQRSAFGDKSPTDSTVLNPITLSFGQGVVGAAAQSGALVSLADTSKDPRYLVDDQSRPSELAVPILHGDRVVGIIDSEHSRRNFFQPEHAKYLGIVAAMLGARIEHEIKRQISMDPPRSQTSGMDSLVEGLDRELSRYQLHAADSSALLTVLRHELRTPLTSILGYTELLQRRTGSSLSEEEQLLTSVIQRNGRLLHDRIETLLRLPELAGPKLGQQRARFDACAQLRKSAERNRWKFEDKGLLLSLNLPSKPVMLEGIANQLSEVLDRLMDNAAKFTQEGEITLSLSCDPTTQSPRSIEITDTGIGINPSQLGLALEPFRQARKIGQTRYGGLGLGLAISKKLCENQGYSLHVRANEGSGTTAFINLVGQDSVSASTRVSERKQSKNPKRRPHSH